MKAMGLYTAFAVCQSNLILKEHLKKGSSRRLSLNHSMTRCCTSFKDMLTQERFEGGGTEQHLYNPNRGKIFLH